MIPRIFHFMWLNLGVEPMRPDHVEYVIGWIAKHPGWQVYFWTKDNLPPLVNQAFFDATICTGRRSDLARYQVLYEFGGVYADVDFECLSSIEEFLSRDILLVREAPDSIGQAIMGCCPKHPFLKQLIDGQMDFANSHPGNAIEQTGPQYVTHTYNNWHEPLPVVENYRVFFPFYWKDANPKPYPESVAIHHMAQTWRKPPMQTSYILPFFHKADLFRMMLPVNDCFRSPDTEVVLVLDEPSEEARILEIVKNNADIKFRVLVNDWDHPWRPPCMAYNVGIRHALADHVVLADPESAFVFSNPNLLKRLIEEDFRCCFVGICWMEDDFKVVDPPAVIRHKIQVCEAIRKVWHIGNGFLMAPKIALERICGYDEGRSTYGYDDNDIRVRLARAGQRCLITGEIKVFHAWHGDTNRTCPEEFPGPNIALTEQAESWGTAYNRVAYDWQKA